MLSGTQKGRAAATNSDSRQEPPDPEEFICTQQGPGTRPEQMIPPEAQVSWLLATLRPRVPERPRAGDNGWTARQCEFDAAAQSKLWTVAQRDRIGVLMIDLDHDDPYGYLLRGESIPPAFIIHHVDNGHSQHGWLLRDPVKRLKRSPERKYFDDVRADLMAVTRADTSFHQMSLCSAPLSAHHGRMLEIVAPEVVELADIGERLTRPQVVPAVRTRFDASAGRNANMFDSLRHVDYSNVRDHMAEGARRLALMRASEVLQRTYVQPLPAAEVSGIIRSIMRWSDTHAHELRGISPRSNKKAAYRLPDAARNADRQAEHRITLTEAQQRANMAASGVATAAHRREATRGRLRAAVGILQHQGQPVTVAALVAVSGLSRRVIYKHADLLPSGTIQTRQQG